MHDRFPVAEQLSASRSAVSLGNELAATVDVRIAGAPLEFVPTLARFLLCWLVSGRQKFLSLVSAAWRVFLNV